MSINWSAILPPYNLARCFAAYRLLEAERDEWKQWAEKWQNYALMSRGMPAVTVSEEPRVSRPGPPPRPSINSLRRRQSARWMADVDPMEAAADEYAARINGGS